MLGEVIFYGAYCTDGNPRALGPLLRKCGRNRGVGNRAANIGQEVTARRQMMSQCTETKPTDRRLQLVWPPIYDNAHKAIHASRVS